MLHHVGHNSLPNIPDLVTPLRKSPDCIVGGVAGSGIIPEVEQRTSFYKRKKERKREADGWHIYSVRRERERQKNLREAGEKSLCVGGGGGGVRRERELSLLQELSTN